MKAFRIGELSKNTGVSIETIRFYEREGLLEEPARLPSGHRQYSSDAHHSLRFIRRAKRLGFTLREIQELLSFKATEGDVCADVCERANAKIADIEARIEALEQMRTALMELTTACAGKGSAKQCLILGALDKDEEAQRDT
jgi:DNA-binding transcriptional MerR regulator